ncbi:hypothetical protein CCAX7_13720 [Capsulimonas corticalis]|uniref:Uncharacterized protein n=1 Tax=Capsulimonas corticalis TaxID=2219043 RepID=A0A402D702_9BACT|nr:hypothetical protein CCAX7_13720 [Capsulimonas corticalis]
MNSLYFENSLSVEKLDGADLRISLITGHHLFCKFVASWDGEDQLAVNFTTTDFIDMPTILHNVDIRPRTILEFVRYAVCSLPCAAWGSLRRVSFLTVRAREGKFYILGSQIYIGAHNANHEFERWSQVKKDC